jgi:multidrug resistance protein, MATE family
MSEREHLPWKHKPFPELVRLAWPIAVSWLSYSTMTLVGTLFVGRLGAEALAGVSVGGTTSFTLLCFGFGALRAVKVLVSQAVGAGARERVHRYLGAGLILAAALGLGNIVLGWLLSGELHRVVASPGAAAHAASYVDARVVGAPFALGAIALREARYGVGDSMAGMRSMLVANVVNIALDYLFVIHLGWGVGGAGWASAIAAMVDFGWLAAALELAGERFGLDRGALGEVRAVWSMGVPLGVQMLLEVGAFAMLTAVFARMGENELAAHQIGIQVIHFSFLPAYALGEAASVLAGQAVGANEDRLVQRIGRLTLAGAVAYTGACSLLLTFFGGPIARAFTGDPRLVETTVRLLYVAAAFQVFDGANVVARGVLRGTGDVRYTAYVSVGIAWAATPPLALGLGYALGWGAVGGWLGLCLEIVAGAAVLWWRLERGGWRRAAAREREKLVAPVLQPA